MLFSGALVSDIVIYPAKLVPHAVLIEDNSKYDVNAFWEIEFGQRSSKALLHSPFKALLVFNLK